LSLSSPLRLPPNQPPPDRPPPNQPPPGWPYPNTPPISYQRDLQVHLQTRMISASRYISKFTQSQSDETAESSWHRKRLRAKESLSLADKHRKRVRGYEGVPAVRNHTNCVNLRNLGKSAWWTTQIVWINESSAKSVLLRYPHISVHLRYLCSSICPPLASLLNWMAVVVRNRFSRHKGLHVHPYVHSISVPGAPLITLKHRL